MNKVRNYQRELDQVIAAKQAEEKIPRLLLHSCCAPCSSYVLEYLARYFSITDYFYNPNITEKTEYQKRTEELRRLISEQPHLNPVRFVEGAYEPERFFTAVKGLESEREGGARCLACFRLRLFEAARFAAEGLDVTENGERVHLTFDFVTTTLTISPLKDAAVLNEVGEEAAEAFGVTWLPSDFKKKGGYQRSIELSRDYGLYRQNFCGCVFSRRS